MTVSEEATGARVRTALDEAGALSGFFATTSSGAAPPGPEWRTFAHLYADPDLLAERTEVVRARLGAGEPRVAASIMFLGLAAKLVSPVLGAAVLRSVVPRLPAASTYWQDQGQAASGPLPVHLAAPRASLVDADDSRTMAETVLNGPLAEHMPPLIAALRARVRVSERLLWGNAASAVGEALCMVGRHRPDLAGRAERLGSAMMLRGPMAGLGYFAQPDPAKAHRFFVRRSCCLYYRLAESGMCGDCALLSPDVRGRQWDEALRGT